MSALLALLGPELLEEARRVHALHEAACERIARAVPGARVRPVPVQAYHVLPALFAEAFPGVPDDALRTVAAAGLLYFSHVLVLDRVMDGDAAPDGADLLAGAVMHERALTSLFPLLPPDTPAWDLLARYGAQYAAAVTAERAHHGAVQPFPWERFETIGAGKAAILKASPMMVACIARRPEAVPALDAVIEAFNVAGQVHDDLEDWRADFRARRFSHLLTLALERVGRTDGEPPAEEEVVGHALFHGGIAEESLRRAVDLCAVSAERAREMEAHGWARYAGLFGERLAKLADGFAEIRARSERISAPAAVRNEMDRALGRFIDRIATEHARGYPEARHTMGFAHALGFTGADEVHHGDVFPRAVLGWAYGIVEQAGHRLPDALRDENLAALGEMRPRGERGGWSYFPTLPELAPDSDDLAQVIHAFGPRAAAEWGALFDVPVRLVLDHHAHADGAVDTWIVDPAAPTDRQARYRAAIERWWGRGVDAEVVANFFAALHFHASHVAPDAIRAGAEWVAARQRDDGSWTSTWYVGPFYGTFAACRLLAAVLPDHASVAQAVGFLRRTQRADGGWAQNGRSDPLSTALALLALLEAGETPGAPSVDAAVKHLLVSQRSDGLWPRSEFIRMDLNRAAGGPARWATYGSASMAAAFAGAALATAARAREAA